MTHFPEFIVTLISLDDSFVSNRDADTVVTNKAPGGFKGCVVVIIDGVSSEGSYSNNRRVYPSR